MFIRKAIVRETDHRLVGLPVRAIVVALPALFLHGKALVVEICLGDARRAHAVGLEKNPQFQLIGGQRLEIISAVAVGRAVGAAAVVLNQNKMFALAHVFRALKQHMLEQMSEAGPARFFIP